MADLTDAQRKRAESRRKRRGQAQEQEPGEDRRDGSAEDSGSGEQPLDAVVQAAKVAAAGAAVGAAAAAARALASHRDEGAVEEAGEDTQPRDELEEASEDAQQPEQEIEAEEPPEPQEQARELEPEPEPEPVEGASLGDAKEVVARAREQLEALLGRRPESVSSVERTHDGWVVALEVVELARVPESTDVLASYELELDEDLNFRRYQQARRYYRSQADHGGER